MPETTERLPLHDDFSCRGAQLETLLESFRAAMGEAAPTDGTDARPTCFVRGTSGMGKSRLISELRGEATKLGARVEEVFCFERQGVPFLPILRAVKDLLGNTESARRVWSRHAAVLARVFPDLVEQLGEPPARVELSGLDGKIQLFDALARLLGEFSQEKPLLLLVHDVHRSDAGTIDFLEYLARNVVLDRASREPRADRMAGAAGDDWKQIRPKADQKSAFVSTTLSSGDSATSEIVTGRLFICVNALAEPSTEVEADPEADGQKGVDQGPSGSKSTDRDGVDDPIVVRLNEFAASPIVRTITLETLDVLDTAQLIERTLGIAKIAERTLRRIHELTGGNPLHIVEVCRVLVEEGLIEPNRNGSDPVEVPTSSFEAIAAPTPDGDSSNDDPQSGLPALVLRRMASLDDDQREIARVLSVMRRPVQRRVLESIVDRSPEAVGMALSRLEARAFVRPVKDRDTERFFLVHEEYVRTICDNLTEEQRQSLHGRIASALAGHAGEPVRTYEFYEHQRQSADAAASIASGLASMRYFNRAYAPKLAAEIGERILQQLEHASSDSTPEDEHAMLRLEIAKIHLRCGDVPIAKSRAKEFIEASKELPALVRLDGYTTLAECYQKNAEPYKGIKMLARGEKMAGSELRAADRAGMASLYARLRLDRQDPKRAINRCVNGLQDLSETPDAIEERAVLLDVLANARLARGEVAGAIQNLQQLLEATEQLDDPHRLAEVLLALGRVYYDRGNYFRAARYLFRGIDSARQAHDPRALTRIYDMLGKVYRNSGDTLRGIEYFNRSLRLRERIGDLEGMSRTLNSLGSLHAHAGDYYRAIRFFQQSVQNAERFGDTGGIVRAFLHLGRVYLDVGELRLVESLSKQILILSQEFNLIELEGEGHRLLGDLNFQRADFKHADRELKKALEIAQKRGRKIAQVSAMLSHGRMLSEKGETEAALKLASKAQILAEEIQSVPQQVRAHLLKGNIFRVHKGGNIERAKESFAKGLELVSEDMHTPLLWQLDYSIAKVFQENFEFAEAHESYRRAQQSVDHIASQLPEDFRVAYLEDRRRRTFFDDYQRFEKEAAGRASSENEAIQPEARATVHDSGLEDRVESREHSQELTQIGLLESVTRVGFAETTREWSRLLLEEARKAVSATSGFVATSREDGIQVLAYHDLPSEMGWASSSELPGALAREVAVSALAVRSGDAQWAERVTGIEGAASYRSRSILVLPIRDAVRVCGVLYLERPSARNPFVRDDLLTLERLTRAVAGPFRMLERLDGLLHVAHTDILTVPGLEERLPEIARSRNEDGIDFALVELSCAGIDERIEELECDETTRDRGLDLIEAADVGADFVVHLGGNALAYGFIGDSVRDIEQHEAALLAAFEEWRVERSDLPQDAACRTVQVEESTTDEADLVRHVWTQLFRRRAEFDLDSEIAALTGSELSLKEAKSALERRYITAELHKSRGNITRAAESLGVHRPQLSSLLKKHNVRREDFE